MDDCEYYSLGLDESTDIRDVCKLVLFDCTIDKNSAIKEEFLKLQPLKMVPRARLFLMQSTKLFLNLLHSRNALVLLPVELNRW
jgi:hypothetical protein